MNSAVLIDGVPFSVNGIDHEGKHFYVHLIPASEVSDREKSLYYCVTAGIYCEDYELESGKITGEIVLYTLEHKDFTEVDFELRAGKLMGRGKATILGEPCTVEIIAPIDLGAPRRRSDLRGEGG